MDKVPRIEKAIREKLHERLDRIIVVELAPSTVFRIRRRRRLALLTSGLAVAASAIGVGWAVTQILPETQRRTEAGPTASSPSTPASTASCQTGPWADHCPEADWAREVVRAAGYSVTGDTGSAITGANGQNELHLWAFQETEPSFEQTLETEGYRYFFSIDGIDVFGDGTRVAWTTHNLYIFLTDVLEGTLDETDRQVIAEFVRASIRTNY